MTKEELKQYRLIEQELIQLEKLLSLAKERDSIKAQNLQRFANEKWDELIDLRTRIETAINTLTTEERIIFRYHYIDGLTWSETADKVYCCDREIYNKRDEILSKLIQ